jgi:microcystin-dependent protein
VADTCTLGQISLYAGNTVPVNEAVANGQSLPIAMNTPLFALIGTTYGGNGTSTFDLSNTESLAPDDMTYTMCVTGLYPETGTLPGSGP